MKTVFFVAASLILLAPATAAATGVTMDASFIDPSLLGGADGDDTDFTCILLGIPPAVCNAIPILCSVVGSIGDAVVGLLPQPLRDLVQPLWNLLKDNLITICVLVE